MIPTTVDQLRDVFPGWLISDHPLCLSLTPPDRGKRIEIVDPWDEVYNESSRCREAYQAIMER